MTSQPEVSPEEPKMLQASSRDPLTSYLGPYCVRVTDSGELLEPMITMDTDEPLMSLIISKSLEAGSETTITTIKEEPLETESNFEEEFERLLESNSVHEEPSAFESSTTEANKSHWNLSRIFTELETNEQCIKFAEDRGLIPTKKICHYHKRHMILASLKGNLGNYRCGKRRCRTRHVSRASGTWFENAKLPMTMVFKIMYMFSHKYSYLDIQKYSTRDEGIKLSTSTISYWFAQCRETIILYHLEHPEGENKIGGPGKVVFLEQSKIGERKLRISQHIEGQWVVGLMEKGNDDLRLEICPDNKDSAVMLIPLIVQKHIEVGTEIRTDSWIAHHCLSQRGFILKTVATNGTNNKEIPLEPMDSNWRRLKSLFQRSRFQGNFTDWLVEYSWRRNIRTSNKCAFEELLKAVQYSY